MRNQTEIQHFWKSAVEQSEVENKELLKQIVWKNRDEECMDGEWALTFILNGEEKST